MKLKDMNDSEVVGVIYSGTTYFYTVEEIRLMTRDEFIRDTGQKCFKAAPCPCRVGRSDVECFIDDYGGDRIYDEMSFNELAPNLVDEVVKCIHDVTLKAGLWYAIDTESEIDIEGFEFKTPPI